MIVVCYRVIQQINLSFPIQSFIGDQSCFIQLQALSASQCTNYTPGHNRNGISPSLSVCVSCYQQNRWCCYCCNFPFLRRQTVWMVPNGTKTHPSILSWGGDNTRIEIEPSSGPFLLYTAAPDNWQGIVWLLRLSEDSWWCRSWPIFCDRTRLN